MNREDKPMLSTDEQIDHLISKGVKFEKISLEDARIYLKQNNNYFKLRAYRKNFPKHPGGVNVGKYINLDFSMLKDLSIIDMRLRYVLLQMALDVEHFSKVELLRAIEESDDDGYQIVEDYFSALKEFDRANKSQRYDHLKNELKRNANNPYCGGIITKYDGCFPVWAFVEIIPLGSFIHFFKFCADKFGRKDLEDHFFLLLTIKELRNAAAHSNCILHNMGAKDCTFRPSYAMTKELKDISKATRNNQLKNARMQQIATLLYAHSQIVVSEGVHVHTRDMLFDMINRMYYHSEYYLDNSTIMSSFEFFAKIVDIFFG